MSPKCGIVCVMAYMGALAVALTFTGEPMIQDRTGVVTALFVSTLFGVVIGKMIDDRARNLPSPSVNPIK